MKKLIIPFVFLVLLLGACTEKKNDKTEDLGENPEQIIKIEKENQEIKMLEETINKEIKEIDALLEGI